MAGGLDSAPRWSSLMRRLTVTRPSSSPAGGGFQQGVICERIMRTRSTFSRKVSTRPPLGAARPSAAPIAAELIRGSAFAGAACDGKARAIAPTSIRRSAGPAGGVAGTAPGAAKGPPGMDRAGAMATASPVLTLAQEIGAGASSWPGAPTAARGDGDPAAGLDWLGGETALMLTADAWPGETGLTDAV